MLYLRICYDAPGTGALRNEVREEHRAYLRQFVGGERDTKLVRAGPMCVSDTDDTNFGSFMIVEAPSIDHLRRLHADDPFTRAGVFARAELCRWDQHIGA